MKSSTLYLLAADAVLVIHALFVLFVVVGLILIAIGGFKQWAWVRSRLFRWLHLFAIAVVVLQAWLGVVCPLTSIEMYFRQRAGNATYSGAFVAHWLEEMLYWRAPAWVFVVAYTAFGLLVAAIWFWIPPAQRGGRAERDSHGEKTAR